eukprot:547406-Pelagomonas_calceolata.AAC.6
MGELTVGESTVRWEPTPQELYLGTGTCIRIIEHVSMSTMELNHVSQCSSTGLLFCIQQALAAAFTTLVLVFEWDGKPGRRTTVHNFIISAIEHRLRRTYCDGRAQCGGCNEGWPRPGSMHLGLRQSQGLAVPTTWVSFAEKGGKAGEASLFETVIERKDKKNYEGSETLPTSIKERGPHRFRTGRSARFYLPAPNALEKVSSTLINKVRDGRIHGVSALGILFPLNDKGSVFTAYFQYSEVAFSSSLT